LKNDELYASSSLEMLKAFLEKTELRYNRKNLGLIENIKALLEALYQVYEPDPFNLTDPFRYQRTETRFSLPYHFSCQIKDAARRFNNALSKIFKGGFDLRKDFLKPAMQPPCTPVGRSIKTR
jgi:hypothetical protein